MRVCLNGKIIEVDEPEIIEEEIPSTVESDKVTRLIEGLSSATTIAQIRDIAKDILENTNESEDVSG